MSEKLETGAVVKLKSGGPVMTVKDVDRETVVVMWYSVIHDQMKTELVRAAMLEVQA